MAFIAAPSLFSKRGWMTCQRPQVLSMCSRDWYPRTLDEVPTPVRIALTREAGKNVKLQEALQTTFPKAEVLELPCVETITGEDRESLPDHITTSINTGWVVITSPEAASVFIAGWRQAGCPPLGRLAAVGRATGDTLRAVGLTVTFEPSKATGRTLAKELPPPSHIGETVLYPASAKASGEVAEELTSKGYSVLRLNTYSTQCATLDQEQKYLAKGAHIVTFASPSAVKGWVSNVGVNDEISVACIGETSAKAAREAGFLNVRCPERPGIEGWIAAICDSMKVHEAARL